MNRMDRALRDISIGATNSKGGASSGISGKGGNRKKGWEVHSSLKDHVFNKGKNKGGGLKGGSSRTWQRGASTTTRGQGGGVDDEEGGKAALQRGATGTLSGHAWDAQEVQGCVSWGSEDLRRKWRDQQNREELYSLVAEREETRERELQAGRVLDTFSVAQHPIVEVYWTIFNRENDRGRKRMRLRLSNRRFVLDVHTVWLTNLAHLKEFRLDEKVGDCEEERDGVMDGSSQIQSVSRGRVLKRASPEGVKAWKVEKGSEARKIDDREGLPERELKVWNKKTLLEGECISGKESLVSL